MVGRTMKGIQSWSGSRLSQVSRDACRFSVRWNRRKIEGNQWDA
jgi:hypothetical protein